MGADIRLIKLRRKAIDEINRKQQSNQNETISMDYFDIIEIKKFNSSDDFVDIMDAGNSEWEDRSDISMQSYPLYCSEDTINTYKKYKGYGDPFEKKTEFLHALFKHNPGIYYT